MKRNLSILILGFLLIGANLFAADGDLIVNGNVGIGTTNPAEKLDVNGNVKANSFIGPGIIKQIQTVSPTTNTETGSSTFVDIPGMTINLTTGSSSLLVFWNVVARQTSSACWTTTEALLDGSRAGVVAASYAGQSTLVVPLGNLAIANVTAGSHTVKIRWKVSCGSVENNPGNDSNFYSRTLTVIEVSQ